MQLIDKFILYREGKWIAPVPPVCTAAWNQADWVKWIDTNGKWLTGCKTFYTLADNMKGETGNE